MTELIGHQGHGDGGVDMLAVARDAELLGLLASRADVPTGGDPVLQLLAAFAADVDAGLDELLATLDHEPLVPADTHWSVVHDLSAARRGHGLRATTVVVVMGATLSLGGVAAAVTGDPLAPVKGIVSAVSRSVSHHDDPTAHADKKLADGTVKDARSRIRSGDYAGAQARMDQLRARLGALDLTAGERHSLEGQLKALENELLAVTREGGNANGADNGHQNGAGGGAAGDEGDSDDHPATAGKPTDQAGPSKPDKPTSGGQGRPGSQGSGSQGSGSQGSGGQGSGGQGSNDEQTGQGGAAGTGDASTAPRPRPSQTGQGATTDPSSGAGDDSSAPAPTAAPADSAAPGADGGNGDGASQDGAKGGAQGATTQANGAADASAQD